jgi:hypothetical protein
MLRNPDLLYFIKFYDRVVHILIQVNLYGDQMGFILDIVIFPLTAEN